MSATNQGSLPDDQEDVKNDSGFWDQYVKEADLYDRGLVKGMDGDLNTLLIFAGLFSAVNTAFIIESYKDLKPDPAESGGTNALLRTLIHTLNNSTTTAIQAPDFVPTPRARVVNALFFASLCCSLFSAFGAVLAKQWLNEYERTGVHRSAYARAYRRHAKYLGMEKYGCEMIMQGLGTVLQVSLFLFLVALADWLWGIDSSIAAIAIAGVAVTFIFYAVTTTISVYDSASPFSTRLSATLRSTWRGQSEPLQSAVTRMEGQCIAWLRDNATTFQGITSMARAASRLPKLLRRELGLEQSRVGPILIQSILSTNAIPLGSTNGTIFSTVNVLRDAMASWEGVPLAAVLDIITQLTQVLRLAGEKDPALSESVSLVLAGVMVPTLRNDSWTAPREDLDIDVLLEFIQIPSLTLEGKRAGISLLWDASYTNPRSIAYAIGGGSHRGRLNDKQLWEVAQILIDSAFDPLDDDIYRFELRLEWAANLGPTRAGVEDQTIREGEGQPFPIERYNSYRQGVGQGWHSTFGATGFLRYLIKAGRLRERANQRNIQTYALDVLSVRWKSSMGGPCSWGPAGLNCEGCLFLTFGILDAAFDGAVEQSLSLSEAATELAPLYWWHHLHISPHNAADSPRGIKKIQLSRLVTERYLLLISHFLLRQLIRRPTVKIEAIPWMADSIRAYVAAFELKDHPETIDVTNHDTKRIILLFHDIREGRYHFQGPTSVGQALWDGLCLVTRCIESKGGGLRSSQDVDWKELTIKGNEGLNFRGFDSY